jgi:hypothetical protein
MEAFPSLVLLLALNRKGARKHISHTSKTVTYQKPKKDPAVSISEFSTY